MVTFNFAEGANLVLDMGNLFEQAQDEEFCMAVGPSSHLNIKVKPSVFCLYAQKSYNVGYDLVNQYVYFQRIYCSLITV